MSNPQETMFQKVKLFNSASGAEVYETYNKENFENEKLLNLRTSLIKEEADEISVAHKEKDYGEIVDGCCDVIYVALGLMDAMGLDGDKCFQYVQDCNMSKFCDSEEDAKKSVQKYLDDPNKIYDSPAYRFNEKSKKWIIYNKSTGKILKAYHFKPPDFSNLEHFKK